MSDSLLLNRYTTTVHYLKEKKQHHVYHQPSNESKGQRNSLEGGSALEEEDTESEEDDDEDLLPSNKEHAHFKQGNTPPAATAAAVTADSSLNKPLSTSLSHPVLSPIQTYSPQLNLGIYSLCSTPISSVRSAKNDLAYKSRQSLPSASSCFANTTVENSTKISSLSKPQKPLYSTSTSSPSIATTIKMDIRSPPQPSQSTSRFMNAFQRFRNPSVNHHTNRQTANNNNSVAPAEISIKPSPSKSSLADKIKTKFQQKRASFVDSTSPRSSSRTNSINSQNKKKCSLEKPVSASGFSMPRSTSISSISQWSSRLTANKVTTPPSKPSGNRLSMKLSHSTSMTSFLGNKPEKTLKPSRSFSSSSSTAGSLSEAATSTVSTVKTPPPSQPLSLTKSISSHRLYKSNTTHGTERPRQPLRAVNPNDSVRFSRGHKPLPPVKNKPTKKSTPSVRFVKVVSIKETFSKTDYDRGSDPDAVCIRLTPAMAQSIKEELNAYKLHEMQVHECSRVHTHFFL